MAENITNTVITKMELDTSDIDKKSKKLVDSSKKVEDQTDKTTKSQKEATSAAGGMSESFDASILSVEGFANASKEAGGTMPALTNGIKSGVSAMGGLIKSSLAFIATPIGVVLAALVGAFLLIKNAMDRSEESTSKVSAAFGAFSGIAGQLLKFLEPLGEFLIDGLVKGFELVEKGLFKTLSAIQSGLSLLGLDDAAKSMAGFTTEVQGAADAGKRLAEADLANAKAQRELGKLQLENLKIAEEFRQVRDDESKTTAERLEANKQLGEALNKQQTEELRVAKESIALAQLRIQLTGKDTKNLDELAEAREAVAEIEERITGQLSEQLVNRVGLQKEAKEAAEAEAALKAEAIAATDAEDAERAAKEDAKAEQDAERLATAVENRAVFNALELEDAQLQADALIEIERLKLETELENETLSADALAALASEFALKKETIQKAADKKKIASEKATTAKIAADKKKADTKKKKDDLTIAQFEAKTKEDLKNQLIGFLGESSAAGQIAALGSIAQSTGAGIAGAVEVGAKTGPFPGNLIAIGAGISAVLAGASQAAKVIGASAPSSGGGGGATSSGGGVSTAQTQIAAAPAQTSAAAISLGANFDQAFSNFTPVLVIEDLSELENQIAVTDDIATL